MRVALIVVIAAVLAAPALGEPKGRSIPSRVADAQVALWRCQDQLGVQRTRYSVWPWSLPISQPYRRWVLNLWTVRLKECRAALAERARQWNWQAFPDWVIRLARCESGLNWWAEGSSSDGTFYSAFNIGRSRYDEVAHKMGVRGWHEGRGVPSPWEQAQAVIGYVRTYGDGFTGRCHGIARSAWT